MSSASVTEFYGLTQYVGTDKPSFTDNNEAFQKVDEDLHEVVQSTTSQAETISNLQESVGSLGDSVAAVEGDVADAKIDIEALQNKEILQDNAITALKTVALDMVCAYNEAAAQSTHSYLIGDYFRYNDVLYRATAAIDIDDTIVPNVNCKATNVTEELLAIIAAGAIDATARAGIEALALQVGALADLATTDKTSIVNAINELAGLKPRTLATATGDGVKTRRELLNTMFASLQGLTEIELLRCSFKTGGNVFHIRSYRPGESISFVGAQASATNLAVTQVIIDATPSSTIYIQSSVNNNGTFSSNDVSTEVVAQGTVYKIVG